MMLLFSDFLSTVCREPSAELMPSASCAIVSAYL